MWSDHQIPAVIKGIYKANNYYPNFNSWYLGKGSLTFCYSSYRINGYMSIQEIINWMKNNGKI